jgi:hypothetical protein
VASPYYYKVIPAMGYVTIELEITDCPGVAVIEHVSFKFATDVDIFDMFRVIQIWDQALTIWHYFSTLLSSCIHQRVLQGPLRNKLMKSQNPSVCQFK